MTLNDVDSINYPPTIAIEDANIIIHQIEDYITSEIWEGFFWDIMSVLTTVVWQSEYNIPVITTWYFNGTPKIESISIKYSTNWDFTKAREVNRQTLEHDLSWYEVNQSDWDPIYFIADNSVFVYPVVKEAIPQAIKLYGIKSLSDVLATTDESEIFGWKIPTKYFYMISDGMSQFIKKAQWKLWEAESVKQIFEKETLPTLINKLGNRKVGISVRQNADVSRYR